jgi:hypothetical protein
MRPSFANSLAQKSEGAGNAGCPLHPQPRVVKKTRELVTTGPPKSSGVSCTMVLTAYIVLSPVTGFVVTVASKKLASRELDASVGASGPHDFAVRVSAARLSRAVTSTASRTQRP